ncbi:WD repeat-containing protein 44 isoform X2 [Planococcus citri]|uniref:WD repeat-containing protein 44 isoform X2 n=1 Tax=Planococcus citri TaxID=170843 RepID=UPI0031F8D67D
MSSSSDNEEFFDAEESNSSPVTKKENEQQQNVFVKPARRSTKLSSDSEFTSDLTLRPSHSAKDANKKDALSNNQKDKNSWNKFKELRQRMQNEEEDGAVSNNSPVDSQVSSVDDVFTGPSNKMLHPFRVIEHDTLSVQSMTSLGRVGRILSGNSEQIIDNREEQPATVTGSTDTLIENTAPSEKVKPTRKPSVEKIEETPQDSSSSSLPKLQEPDVIASTKNSNSFIRPETPPSQSTSEPAPVAPPRRKKKLKAALQQSVTVPLQRSESVSIASSKENIPMYNSQTTIENLTKELEHSLDIKLASKGEYVVKPQDDESKRAESIDSPNEVYEPSKNKFSACCGSGTYPLPNSNCSSSLARNSSTYPLSSASSHSVGGTRAGLGLRFGVSPQRNKERRKSTGDENSIPQQLNMFVRTRTDSGKQLTDMEILEQVTVLNLDTGERVPLSIAEDKLPQCMNPLSLHIMRLTSEYVSNSSLEKRKESDEESIDSKKSFATTTDGDQDSVTVMKRTAKLKRFLGSTVRKTVSKAKTIAQEVSHVRHKEDITDIRDDVNQQNEPFKLRASNSHKGPFEFLALQHVQEFSGEHVGPVWCMKFSSCGRLLATAGQDRILRIWVIRSAYTYFQEMRTKYNAEKSSPTPSQESLVSQHSVDDPNSTLGEGAGSSGADENTPFMPKPFCTYTGHTSDLLDVSWSKNYFVLSSSMDKTVRLWHISRKECLCCFQHIDFVTAICFLPKDDRYFLSGSLDGKLRLWNIPDKKVAVWTEIDGSTKLITAANFCQNGKFAVVGSYDGRCIFYNTDQLRYHTQIHVRSTRGKNSRGRKISGIEPMPGEDKILVTSNDSRIRLYDLIDLNLSCKYKGYVNVSSQIKASFSHDGKFIVCGSENQSIYIWKTHHDYSKFPSVRRDRNDFWEGIKAHNAVVTCAIFAPNPSVIIQQLEEKKKEAEAQSDDPLLSQHTQGAQGYVLVSADFNGCIRVFLNKTKPKHSSLPASALA